MRERTQKPRASALETQGVALGTQGVVGTERPSGSAFIAVHSLREPSMRLASSSPVAPTTEDGRWPLLKSRRFTPVYGCWKHAEKRHFAPHFEPMIGQATRCESFHMLNLDHGFGYWLHPLRELKTLVALLRRKRHNEMTVLFTIRSCPRLYEGSRPRLYDVAPAGLGVLVALVKEKWRGRAALCRSRNRLVERDSDECSKRTSGLYEEGVPGADGLAFSVATGVRPLTRGCRPLVGAGGSSG
jgi:hypothetical protein